MRSIKAWWARFRCETLDWHTPAPNSAMRFDGVSLACRCERCNRRILQDSQGNWFSAHWQDENFGDNDR